jgi:hypothetical protein
LRGDKLTFRIEPYLPEQGGVLSNVKAFDAAAMITASACTPKSSPSLGVHEHAVH